MAATTTTPLPETIRRVLHNHRIAIQHPDTGAVTCAHDSNGLATYSTTEYAEHLNAEILTVVAAHTRSQRDAFLSSPTLDPAWIAGWHSATDHIAHHITAATTPVS